MDPDNDMHNNYRGMRPNYSRLLSPSVIAEVCIDNQEDNVLKPPKKDEPTWYL